MDLQYSQDTFRYSDGGYKGEVLRFVAFVYHPLDLTPGENVPHTCEQLDVLAADSSHAILIAACALKQDFEAGMKIRHVEGPKV